MDDIKLSNLAYQYYIENVDKDRKDRSVLHAIDVVESFKDMTNFYLKSIWHDRFEVPQIDKTFLYAVKTDNEKGYITEIDKILSSAHWDDFLDDYDVVCWCYIEDLFANGSPF